LLGKAPAIGNRKDIRNAVEAARKAKPGQSNCDIIELRFSTTSQRIFTAQEESPGRYPPWSEKQAEAEVSLDRAHLLLRGVGR